MTAIGGQAFNAKAAVTALTIPNTVTTIGYQAFMEMDGLTEFVMPDSVTSIGYGLFYGCSNLEEVKLSKNLAGTMQTTFAYCAKLNACVIPDGVTTLNKTFMYCNIIKTVFVPASVTNITGDDGADIRNRLFSTFNVEETITGAPTEPGFVVMGEANSTIATYINGAGWNFQAVDTSLPLALTAPRPHEDGTVTVDVVNFGKTDKQGPMTVYGAYFRKVQGSPFAEVALARRNSIGALTAEHVTLTMNDQYDANEYFVKAFVWDDASMQNLSDYSELYEELED